MQNEELINSINESDIYGAFIEIGAGQPVANEIFQISGASKTIQNAASPYSKEFQERVFGTAGIRSVSKEFIKKVISTVNTDPAKTLYVSSFQIADKPGMITHGWIGIRYKENIKIFHLTITSATERKNIIQLIGSIGLRLLYCKNDLRTFFEVFKKESAMYSCIDIIVDGDDNSYLAEAIGQCENGLSTHITIDKDGKLIRLEDILRKGDIILMKGSFNPVHNHHIEMMKLTQQAYPTATPCFIISLDTYEKGHLNIYNVIGRIKMLNKLGYPVIIMRKGLFNQNTYTLREHRFYDKKIIFPLGTDTLNRLINSSYDKFAKMEKTRNVSVAAFETHFENVEFPYMIRPGTPILEQAALVPHFKSIGKEWSDESSTTVRELYSKGDYEAIKKMIPKEIHDLYFTFAEEQVLRELAVLSNP